MCILLVFQRRGQPRESLDLSRLSHWSHRTTGIQESGLFLTLAALCSAREVNPGVRAVSVLFSIPLPGTERIIIGLWIYRCPFISEPEEDPGVRVLFLIPPNITPTPPVPWAGPRRPGPSSSSSALHGSPRPSRAHTHAGRIWDALPGRCLPANRENPPMNP